MDLQRFIDNAIKQSRINRMANSDQLSLGEIIAKLKPIVDKQKDREEEATVSFDFADTFPTKIDSWRGSYAELALNYQSEGENMRVTAFYDMLVNTVGKTLEGYKGGDFVMDESTPVWVANWGRCGNTAVIDVIDEGWQVLIMTGYREF